MASVRAWLLRGLGLLILATALLAAAFKADERPVQSLVARWAPAPSDFVEVDWRGRTQLVHLRDEGPRSDRHPLLMLHATGSSLHSWEGWVAGLKSERRVITLDLPGFGLTGPSAWQDYGDASYLDFLQTLIAQLELPPVVLVGNSLGGELAWQYALLHPTQVAGLVLVDAAGASAQPAALPVPLALARLPGLGWLSRSLLPRQLVEASLARSYGEPGLIRPERVDRYFELLTREGNREALLQRLGQAQPVLDVSRLSELHVPTLLLWGGRDRILPPEQGLRLHQLIAGSRWQRFDTLGHLPQEEDPEATLPALLDFLHTLKP